MTGHDGHDNHRGPGVSVDTNVRLHACGTSVGCITATGIGQDSWERQPGEAHHCFGCRW
jgi:hypothetical protein